MMISMSNKKIALIGARGIANYGGFETFVSEFAPRLVKNGFEVYCSCEKAIKMPSEYKGAKLIYFPIKMSSNYQLRKVIEFFYDIYFGLICSFKCDVIYFLGFSANIFTFFPRLIGKKSFVNMAGVEWERSKFSKMERSLLKFFFKLSLIGSNHVIIDNQNLINYIDKKYHHKIIYLTYGVNEIPEIGWNQEITNSYTKSCVKPEGYWLAVVRLQPDNNIETILNGFIESESEKPLIIIGDFSCEIDYEKSIKKILEDNPTKQIIFTGGIYDQDHLNIFRQNCFGYIHAHSIGGTNPSLLEAMIMKNIIIAHDNEFNREVAGHTAVYFKNSHDLKDKLESVEKNYDDYLKLKRGAYNTVKKNYSWDCIIDEYKSVFMEIERR
jgi:rhamnosyltransferase